MNTRWYALWGALLGALFPVAATLLQAALDASGSGYWSRVVAAQRTPLLWFVDTAPLFLGLLASVAGRRADQRLSAEQARRAAVESTSTELHRAARELLATVSSFSALTSQTAASVRETTSTMSRLSQTTTHAALTAETVVGLAESSRRCSENGLRAVDEATEEMLHLAGDVRELSDRIEQVNSRMRDILEVASAVGSLSERAQHIAARATREIELHPPTPALVAIVADVQHQASDAQRTAAAVKSMLGETHKAMLAAMTAAEKGIQRAERGAEVARNTGKTIHQLAEALQNSSRAARNIAQVAQQQDQGVDEVLRTMNEIYLATEQAAAGTLTVAGGARALTDLADRLEQSVQVLG